LRQQIQSEKQTKEVDAIQTWWDEQLARLSKMSVNDQVVQVELLARNPKARNGWIVAEILMYRLHLNLVCWIDDPAREDEESHNRYAVSVLRLVREVYALPTVLPTDVLGKLGSALSAIGFEDYIAEMEAPFVQDESRVDPKRKLRFTFVKIIKSKSNSLVYEWMKINEHPVRWQLRVFGEFMDRSMDSAPDSRVQFHPDAWQRRVLDCLDEPEHSVLVIGGSLPLTTNTC
jgi:ATP-dependent RNA helicase DDX60